MIFQFISCLLHLKKHSERKNALEDNSRMLLWNQLNSKIFQSACLGMRVGVWVEVFHLCQSKLQSGEEGVVTISRNCHFCIGGQGPKEPSCVNKTQNSFSEHYLYGSKEIVFCPHFHPDFDLILIFKKFFFWENECWALWTFQKFKKKKIQK